MYRRLAGIVSSTEEPLSFWSVCRPTLGSEVRVMLCFVVLHVYPAVVVAA